MAKKLIINCTSCDARNIQEENYAHYESITMNCTLVLANARAKEVLNKLPVALNCTNMLEMDEDVDLRVVNGGAEIKSNDIISPVRFYLMVNGSMTIGSDTKKQLAQCIGMTVNGSLTCPESVYASLAGVKVNGSVTCYPDGAVILKSNAVIDKLFALRAKNRLYWSSRRIIMTDSELDPDMLRSKGAHFSAQEVIIAESKVEGLLELIDEKAEIIIVPDNTTVVLDDITLDETALQRYGRQLYVIGDVTIPEYGAVLDQWSYLNIRGDAWVFPKDQEKFFEIVTKISGQVKTPIPEGATIQDKFSVKITKWMLEQQSMILTVRDCMMVKIADDIPKKLMMDRLRIEDCASVKCSEELEDVVSMICTDVAQIGNGNDENQTGILQGILGGLKGALDTKVVNATEYVM